MHRKSHTIAAMIIGGFFLFADQLFKHIARADTTFTWTTLRGWIGWQHLENPGVAFGLPIPNSVILIITPLILIGIVWLYGSPTPTLRSTQDSVSFFARQRMKRKKRDYRFVLACTLVFFGAISNYIDRVVFGVTIDYLRFFTSIINLADVMIVFGAALLLLGETKPIRSREK